MHHPPRQIDSGVIHPPASEPNRQRVARRRKLTHSVILKIFTSVVDNVMQVVRIVVLKIIFGVELLIQVHNKFLVDVIAQTCEDVFSTLTREIFFVRTGRKFEFFHVYAQPDPTIHAV